MKGLSITFVFGKYGGFYVWTTDWTFRVCLGWFALTVYWRTDIEAFIEYLKSKNGKHN